MVQAALQYLYRVVLLARQMGEAAGRKKQKRISKLQPPVTGDEWEKSKQTRTHSLAHARWGSSKMRATLEMWGRCG